MVHGDQQGCVCWPKQKLIFFYAYVYMYCKWTDMVNSQSGLESAITWPYTEHDLNAWLDKHNFQNIWTKSGDPIAINNCCCTFYALMAEGAEIDFCSGQIMCTTEPLKSFWEKKSTFNAFTILFHSVFDFNHSFLCSCSIALLLHILRNKCTLYLYF